MNSIIDINTVVIRVRFMYIEYYFQYEIMAEIMPIRRKILSNQSINMKLVFTVRYIEHHFH